MIRKKNNGQRNTPTKTALKQTSSIYQHWLITKKVKGEVINRRCINSDAYKKKPRGGGGGRGDPEIWAILHNSSCRKGSFACRQSSMHHTIPRIHFHSTMEVVLEVLPRPKERITGLNQILQQPDGRYSLSYSMLDLHRATVSTSTPSGRADKPSKCIDSQNIFHGPATLIKRSFYVPFSLLNYGQITHESGWFKVIYFTLHQEWENLTSTTTDSNQRPSHIIRQKAVGKSSLPLGPLYLWVY